MARTIQSPGVEINEIDLSLRPALPAGTNILIPGFSPQGPVDEVLQVASLSEFEQIYGLPTNATERYFYHTVKGTFQSQANIYVSRLPYGEEDGHATATNQYSATCFPITASTTDPGSGNTTTSPLTGANVDTYTIGAPTVVDLSMEQFLKIQSGDLTWGTAGEGISGTTAIEKIEGAGLVVLNNKSLVINEKFEGYYIGIVDNEQLDPGSAHDGIQRVRSINKNSQGEFFTIPADRFNFELQSTTETGTGKYDYKSGSVSEVLENLHSSDISTSDHNDILTIGLFKIRKSTVNPDTEKLDYVLSEYHSGSLNAAREQNDPAGGPPKSWFISNTTKSSPNFQVLVNPNISQTGDWVDRVTEPLAPGLAVPTTRKSRMDKTTTPIGVATPTNATALFAHGIFKEASGTKNVAGQIPNKLNRIFELIDNHELYPLDLTLEAGLGTIYAATDGGKDDANYDDEKFLDISEPKRDGGGAVITGPDAESLMYKSGEVSSFKSDGIVMNYRSVANVFVEFASLKRKDHMCILDPLRHIFVQGLDNKTLNNKDNNFSQHIYQPLRHTMGTLNSSYAATYGNWGLVYDGQLGRNIWVPLSGYIGAMYANTDSNFQPWFAPAGFTRGVLTGINDLAIYPKQKHRDQLYKISVNPVASFPNDGFVVFGQKTLQAKPSAFDRVNVRRLFLWLEKATRSTVKYFVFEPNTLFTRTQVSNVLTPIFDIAKNTQGLYDYLLICDERNNTPDVIDQNEMVVDIYIKPVRAAEFILVNFYATRSGQDFSELVS